MLKTFLIFINLTLLVISGFFNIEDIVITHTGPNEISAGEKVEVSIVINKMDFSGPGRLKLDLSNAEGINIIEKNNDGSSFTFKNNEALFIWYDLPNNKNIEITYLIDANINTSGLKKINGTFSFINQNDRKQLAIPELAFQVNEVIQQGGEPSVAANRTIEGQNGEYIVKIHVTKGKHGGFARIKDIIPDDYSAESVESAGGIFKNIDGSAKFIWSDLPSSIESFTVTYKLMNPSKRDTNFFIKGEYASERLIAEGHNDGIDIPITYYTPDVMNFNYNELTNDTSSINDTDLTHLIDTNNEITIVIDSNINLNEDTIIEFVENDKNSDSISDLVEEENLVEEEIVQELSEEETEITEAVEEVEEIIEEEVEEITEAEVKEDNITASVSDETIEESVVSNIINNQKVKNNIDYRVQIIASHRIATKNFIKSKYNFTANYDLENHEGWIKYTTGNFSNYKEARDKRNNLKVHNFPGPFVTAYNYGQRITVQEALILSEQTWIP